MPKVQYKVVQGGGSQDILGRSFRDSRTGQFVRQTIPAERLARLVKITRLPTSIGESQLIDLCQSFGPLQNIQVFTHKHGPMAGFPTGTAIVEFLEPGPSEQAIAYFNSNLIQQRQVHAQLYDPTEDAKDAGNKSFSALRRQTKDAAAAVAAITTADDTTSELTEPAVVDNIPYAMFEALVLDLETYLPEDDMPIFGLKPLYDYMNDTERKNAGLESENSKQHRQDTASFSKSVAQAFSSKSSEHTHHHHQQQSHHHQTSSSSSSRHVSSRDSQHASHRSNHHDDHNSSRRDSRYGDRDSRRDHGDSRSDSRHSDSRRDTHHSDSRSDTRYSDSRNDHRHSGGDRRPESSRDFRSSRDRQYH